VTTVNIHEAKTNLSALLARLEPTPGLVRVPLRPRAAGAVGRAGHGRGGLALTASSYLASAFPPIHKDPMDRMPIAQARRLGMIVVTDDGLFQAHGVATVWSETPAHIPFAFRPLARHCP
jgi:hypothetical protein